MNFSGKWFNPVSYGVRQDTELIDYDQVRDMAREHQPKMIICGATAYPRLIDFAAFRSIADEVGAILMVDAAHFIGLVAGGAIPSPVPYADVVCFTTHKVLRGPRGGMIVCREEHAAKIDKAVFPFLQGGPLMHAVAAKAVVLKECGTPAYQAYATRRRRQRPGARRGARRRGHAPGLRRHRHPPRAHRPPWGRRHRHRRRAAVRRRADHAEQERHPLRPAAARWWPAGSGSAPPRCPTQGMGPEQMPEVASLIARAVQDTDGTATAEVAEAVSALTAKFPAYPHA